MLINGQSTCMQHINVVVVWRTFLRQNWYKSGILHVFPQSFVCRTPHLHAIHTTDYSLHESAVKVTQYICSSFSSTEIVCVVWCGPFRLCCTPLPPPPRFPQCSGAFDVFYSAELRMCLGVNQWGGSPATVVVRWSVFVPHRA